METHSFIYNGITGNIEYDSKSLKFYYTLINDNVRVFERISFFEEDAQQEYECRFTSYLNDKFGEEISGTRKIIRYRISSEEVDGYQKMILSTVTEGITYLDFTKKSTINGLVAGLKNFGCTTVKEGEIISSDINGRDGFTPYDAVSLKPIANP